MIGESVDAKLQERKKAHGNQYSLYALDDPKRRSEGLGLVRENTLYTRLSESSEFKSLIKGLRWVVSQQNSDGGWSRTVDQFSNSEPTGHILYVLNQLGCVHTICARKAISWLEDASCQNKSAGTYLGWNSRDDWWDKVTMGGTLIGATSLMVCAKNEEPPQIIPASDLTKMIMAISDKLISFPDQMIAEQGWWTFQMVCVGLHLAGYKGKAWDKLQELALERRRHDGTWEHDGREFNNQTAAVLLGLLQNPKVEASVIRSVLEILLSKMQSCGDKGFWVVEPEDQSGKRRGAFFATRWVVWALEEAREHGIIVKGQTETIDKAIKWLTTKQQTEGDWIESEGDVSLPSFSSYALLVIGKNLLYKFREEADDLRTIIIKEVKAVEKRIEYCVRIGGYCPHKIVPNAREVFVLMPFREKFDCVWKALKSVGQEMGIPFKRADDSKIPQEIMCDICRGIQSASWLVADISTIPYEGKEFKESQGTDHRISLEVSRNVLYELGIAHALEKPVILISRNKPDVFNFRNMRSIEYTFSQLDDLADKLQKALVGIQPEFPGRHKQY